MESRPRPGQDDTGGTRSRHEDGFGRRPSGMFARGPDVSIRLLLDSNLAGPLLMRHHSGLVIRRDSINEEIPRK
ncbi:hypothetical protein F441_16137 [Phytophthora nicotianae CJ01A1]|uniref:Uncharacterized protein n=3 Tax=Phytophthora nicotianae TaxID=4792 RepID=W2YL68_PHYNI|nr:hypothetical protein F444_16307 [Phytophthora nicotianae P1976]ETP07723.1 hypothetical protein F441_16137 [Phytophthora nicotianae CJ01A1]ETP35765.1 hypothetical protein F442_16168 [Phytophthora nicotianae P10297]